MNIAEVIDIHWQVHSILWLYHSFQKLLVVTLLHMTAVPTCRGSDIIIPYLRLLLANSMLENILSRKAWNVLWIFGLVFLHFCHGHAENMTQLVRVPRKWEAHGTDLASLWSLAPSPEEPSHYQPSPSQPAHIIKNMIIILSYRVLCWFVMLVYYANRWLISMLEVFSSCFSFS